MMDRRAGIVNRQVRQGWLQKIWNSIRPRAQQQGDGMFAAMRNSIVWAMAVVLGAPAQAEPANQPPATEPDMIFRLWDGDPPGAQGKEAEDIPSITVYPPAADKA